MITITSIAYEEMFNVKIKFAIHKNTLRIYKTKYYKYVNDSINVKF